VDYHKYKKNLSSNSIKKIIMNELNSSGFDSFLMLYYYSITIKGGHKNFVFVTAGSPAGLIKGLPPLLPRKYLVIRTSLK